jgi:molybdopterin-biosynthesis enzyme MoeA-like protein
MRSEVIRTGDKVLTSRIVNTNCGAIGRTLEDVGLSV